MENKTLDIVNLIDNNPLINLNRTYQSKFITKIKEKFTEPQQQIFAASFYAYLNYNKTDFVIVLNDIWKWLGFSRKEECKRVLVKHFKQDVDYKIFTEGLGEENFAPQVGGAKTSPVETRGGSNKEKILGYNYNFGADLFPTLKIAPKNYEPFINIVFYNPKS